MQFGNNPISIENIYEGQYKQTFSGFGRFMTSKDKLITIGWWKSRPYLNGKAIYIKNNKIQ